MLLNYFLPPILQYHQIKTALLVQQDEQITQIQVLDFSHTLFLKLFCQFFIIAIFINNDTLKNIFKFEYLIY